MRYKKIQSSTGHFFVAFTKTSNKMTNSPIQSLNLNYGRPCAYTNSRTVLEGSEPEQILYPLETESRVDQCGMLPKEKGKSKKKSASDLRYEQVFSLNGTKPNELEIQTLSGVLDTEVSEGRYLREVSEGG